MRLSGGGSGGCGVFFYASVCLCDFPPYALSTVLLQPCTIVDWLARSGYVRATHAVSSLTVRHRLGSSGHIFFVVDMPSSLLHNFALVNGRE